MLFVSHKLTFVENETVWLVCVTMRERTRQNLAYNFLIQLLRLQSLAFAVHFSNAFWHGSKAFPKGSSQNEIVSLFIIFHLPYRQYRGVKKCFHSCHYQNQNFSLLSHSCNSCSTRFALVSFMSHSCFPCVAPVKLVLLVSGTRVVKQTRSKEVSTFTLKIRGFFLV